MKPILILLAIASSLEIQGQETIKSNPVEKFRRLFIGVNFSPDYAFRTLKNGDGSSAGGGTVIKVRNDRPTVVRI